MISFDEAAIRLGLTTKAFEECVKKGMLGLAVKDRMIDEEELAQIAECVGWLEISSADWDDDGVE